MHCQSARCGRFARDPELLANRVYAGRIGNGDAASGDGYRYRGRGYLQLTGRANYRAFGQRLGIDLERHPERAEEPEIAWRIAACYFATRPRAGLTALKWADADNVEAIKLRHGLVRALGSFGASNGLLEEALIESLDDAAATVRSEAAHSLRRLGTRSRAALSKLREIAASDKVAIVREAADMAVRRLQ